MGTIDDLVLALLARGATLRTWLRERGLGDVHDSPAVAALAGLPVAADQLVLALEQLERQGRLAGTETVHPHDSTEYAVTWRLAHASRRSER